MLLVRQLNTNPKRSPVPGFRNLKMYIKNALIKSAISTSQAKAAITADS